MKGDPRRRDPGLYPWRVVLQTRFIDMDVNFHLNNVAVARLFEEARVRWNRETLADFAPRPRFVVAHVGIDYLEEGRYPADVTVAHGIAALGNTSFTIALAAFQNDRAMALCQSVLVHRGADGQPAPLPPELRARLEAFRLNG